METKIIKPQIGGEMGIYKEMQFYYKCSVNTVI